MNTITPSHYKANYKYNVITSFKNIKEGDAIMFNPSASIKRFIYQPLDYRVPSKDEKTKNLLICLEQSKIYINSLHNSQGILDKNILALINIINTQDKLDLYKTGFSPELKKTINTIKEFDNYISEVATARLNHSKLLTHYLSITSSLKSNRGILINSINNKVNNSDEYCVSETPEFKAVWDVTLEGLNIDNPSFYFKDIILIPLPSVTSYEANFSVFRTGDQNVSEVCLGYDKRSIDNYFSYCRSLSNYGISAVRYLDYIKNFQDKLDIFPSMDLLLQKYKTTKSILSYTMIVHGTTSKGVDIFLPIDHCQPVPDNLSFLQDFKDSLLSKYLS